MRTIIVRSGTVGLATLRVPRDGDVPIDVHVDNEDAYSILNISVQEVRPEAPVEATPPEDQTAADIGVDQVAGDIDAGPRETAEASQETIDRMAADVDQRRGRRRRGKQ